MLGRALGVVAAALPLVALSSTGAPVSPPGCSQADQDTGLCLGWFQMPGLSPLEAAVLGALMGGDVEKAGQFLARAASQLPQPRRNELLHVIDLERQAAGAGIEYLESLAPQVLNADLRVAARDSRGNCCAIDPYRWKLMPEEYPYGHCRLGEGCPTDGTVRVEMQANIFFFPQVAYGHRFDRISGPDVTMRSLSVTMKRDRNLLPDPTISTYDCPDGNLPLSCQTQNRESGTAVHEYYYIVTRFTIYPAGVPSSSGEFQTRRWTVNEGGQPDFPASRTGG